MELLLTPPPSRAPRPLETAILRYYGLSKAEQDLETRLGALRVSEGKVSWGQGWQVRQNRWTDGWKER